MMITVEFGADMLTKNIALPTEGLSKEVVILLNYDLLEVLIEFCRIVLYLTNL